VSCPWPVTVAPFRARFGARRIAEKNTIWRTKKEKRARIAHEEINKTRDGRCMRKFQKPGFSGAKIMV
jgi:hypothetical protein